MQTLLTVGREMCSRMHSEGVAKCETDNVEMQGEGDVLTLEKVSYRESGDTTAADVGISNQ